MLHNNNIKNKTTNKRFGLFFSFLILCVILFIYLKNNTINYYLSSLLFFLLLISLFYPKLLSIPNFLWFKFGLLINKILSPIVLILLYLIFFVPFGIIFKLFKIDLLSQRINIKKHSYWVDRQNKYKTDFKNQY
jgi:hypothetical protein